MSENLDHEVDNPQINPNLSISVLYRMMEFLWDVLPRLWWRRWLIRLLSERRSRVLRILLKHAENVKISESCIDGRY